MESMCPALADGFLPTVPLGKNRKCRILRDFFFFLSCWRTQLVSGEFWIDTWVLLPPKLCSFSQASCQNQFHLAFGFFHHSLSILVSIAGHQVRYVISTCLLP